MLPMIFALEAYIESLLSRHEEAQGMVEYVLIIGAISVAILVAFQTTPLATAIQGLSTGITNLLNTAAGNL